MAIRKIGLALAAVAALGVAAAPQAYAANAGDAGNSTQPVTADMLAAQIEMAVEALGPGADPQAVQDVIANVLATSGAPAGVQIAAVQMAAMAPTMPASVGAAATFIVATITSTGAVTNSPAPGSSFSVLTSNGTTTTTTTTSTSGSDYRPS